MRPTLPILMLIAICLLAATVWILTALHQHRAEQYRADSLQECVSTTGHKKVPCPESE